MRSSTLSLAMVGALAATAVAQVHVIPNGTATQAGNSSSPFPWGTSASTMPGLRLMAVYDSTNFTAAAINTPILISRLRWRANESAATTTWTGGVFTTGTVRMSTAAVNWSAVTTTFASNHGANLTTCYTGPVTYLAGAGLGTGVPGPYVVNILLTTPFLYDPAAGDLNIDCDYPGGTNFVGGSLAAVDVQTTNSNSSRVYASTTYPAATALTTSHGPVVEITYSLPPGLATGTAYGAGCYDRAASFYEVFPMSTFDLSNRTIRMTPSGSGYAVTSVPNTWFTPVSGNMFLADDQVSGNLALGFTLNYPGGSTTDVFASSNGFVWAQTNTDHGCCPDPALLRTSGARWCPVWCDLDPSSGGSITFDTVPASNAAYLTYTSVPEFNTASVNSFQVAFFATGVVEIRYRPCAVTAHVALAGWSPGNNNRDPGNRDLSTALPFTTATDQVPLAFAGSPRPVLGRTVTLTTTNVPAGAPLGATILSYTQHNPGLDLTSIGMPGCRQFTALTSSQLFIPAAGTGSTTLAIPVNASYVGAHVYGQSAAFAAGVNPLGVLASNGWNMLIGLL